MKPLILLFLTLFLMSCNSSQTDSSLLLTTGYSATVGNVTSPVGHPMTPDAQEITIPRYIPAGDDYLNYTSEFKTLGHLMMQWNNSIAADPNNNNRLKSATGFLINYFPTNVTILYYSSSDLLKVCGPRAAACTDISELPDHCTIKLPYNPNEALMGHEMWHCIAGDFHPGVTAQHNAQVANEQYQTSFNLE